MTIDQIKINPSSQPPKVWTAVGGGWIIKVMVDRDDPLYTELQYCVVGPFDSRESAESASDYVFINSDKNIGVTSEYLTGKFKTAKEATA